MIVKLEGSFLKSAPRSCQIASWPEELKLSIGRELRSKARDVKAVRDPSDVPD
jgi:hypothetical protein